MKSGSSLVDLTLLAQGQVLEGEVAVAANKPEQASTILIIELR